MGLDSVDLILNIEESFGITFDERGVSRVVTVGDLCDLVYSAAPTAKQAHCLTALAFWRIRRALVEGFSLERDAIRPRTPLAKLMWPGGGGAAVRRAAWSRLEELVGLELPPLQRPAKLVVCCIALWSVTLIAGLVRASTRGESWGVIGFCLVFAWALGAVTLPWKAHLSARVSTVGDLARAVLLTHARTIAAPIGGFTKAQVESIVTRIISENHGIPLEEVTLDARIVRDLGID